MEKEKIVLRKRVVVVDAKPTLETVQDVELKIGHWAVMRQARSMRRMHLSVLHDSYQTAITEAERLHKENPDFKFYVLTIVGEASQPNG